jgi:hypothetical protein
MKRWGRIFGVLALVLGALSFTPYGENFAWGALKPAAAILFGAFLICKVLAPEYAKYNQEERKRRAAAEGERAEHASEDEHQAQHGDRGFKTRNREPISATGH